jgi:hypothetical protein
MSTAFSDSTGSGIWCTISGGKVRRKATEDTPKAVKIEIMNKDGTPSGEHKWVLQNDRVTGVITDMKITEKEFNGETMYQLVIRLIHDNKIINLALKQGDRYWRAFMVRLPNLDLSKEVTFAPFDFKDRMTGKDIIGMNLLQDDKKIPPAFTKDNRGGMPDMDKVMYKGKERADFSRQDDWLNSQVLMAAIAKLRGFDAQQAPKE